MQKVEFVELKRKVNYDDIDVVYNSHYGNIAPEKDVTGAYKNRLYLVVASVFGELYVYEIGKKVRKYSSGQTQTPVMIERMSESLKEKELLLNSEGEIENLDKILKEVVTAWGYH